MQKFYKFFFFRAQSILLLDTVMGARYKKLYSAIKNGDGSSLRLT
jgi:hypothetical protein